MSLTAEFVLINSFVLILLAVTIIFLEANFFSVQNNIVEQKISELSDTLLAELSTAHKTGFGYERTITVPYTIQGIDYDIKLVTANPPLRDAIIITTDFSSYTYFIPFEVQGIIKKGQITINGGDPVIIS